jgi:uncharacterized membrane protein
MSTTPDKLVERYLKHLEVELDELPRDRRREIVDEIAGHIAEARAGLEHETEADVRNILEGLGDPADIADDARERFDVEPTSGASPHKARWIEVGALLLVVVLGLVLLLLILGALGLMVGSSSLLAILACAAVLFFVLYRRRSRTRARLAQKVGQ